MVIGNWVANTISRIRCSKFTLMYLLYSLTANGLSVRNTALSERTMLLLLICVGTIFAYGQTGTGKTFTMAGVPGVSELRGIIPNSFAHIFGHIAKCEGEVR